jgi:hypothetical protein
VTPAHAIAFALPLLPGRTEDDRVALASCWTGPRREPTATLGTSPDPFDLWLREHVLDVHGIALADGLPAPERLLHFDVDDV